MKSKAFTGKVWVELVTIKDKKRLITAPRPTEYYVQIWFEHLCVREVSYEDKKHAKDHYAQIRRQLENQVT